MVQCIAYGTLHNGPSFNSPKLSVETPFFAINLTPIDFVISLWQSNIFDKNEELLSECLKTQLHYKTQLNCHS